VSGLSLEEVREEQQKYMKEKRALNIARRTWFESFKDREGRTPTDEEAKQVRPITTDEYRPDTDKYR
jgi:hypothetical protein